MAFRTVLALVALLGFVSLGFGGWSGAGTYETNEDLASTPSLTVIDYHAGYNGGGEAGVMGDWAFARAKYHVDGYYDEIFGTAVINEDDNKVEAKNRLDAYWVWGDAGGAHHMQMYTDLVMTEHITGDGSITVYEEDSYSETTSMTTPYWSTSPSVFIAPEEFCQEVRSMSATGTEEATDSDTYSIPYQPYIVTRTGLQVPPGLDQVWAEYDMLTKLVWAGEGWLYTFSTGADFFYGETLKSETKDQKAIRGRQLRVAKPR